MGIKFVRITPKIIYLKKKKKKNEGVHSQIDSPNAPKVHASAISINTKAHKLFLSCQSFEGQEAYIKAFANCTIQH